MGETEMTSDETRLFLMGQLESGLEVGEVQSVGSVCV